MSWRSRLVAGALAACWALGSPALRANDADAAMYADQLFQHGVELMKSDECPKAIPEFLTSQELDPSAATLLNLATCYARLGRHATAWRVYKQAASAASVEGNPDLQAQAVKAMSALGPMLTKLKIVTANRSPAFSLRLNGERLTSYDGAPVPLDPGENVIEAVAPGREPWRRSVTASENGSTIVIEVPELRPAAKPAQSGFRTAAVVVGGVGVAGVVVGAILGVNAKDTYDDADPYCRAGRCTAPGVDLRNEASGKATAATLAVGIGLATVATGVVLWLTSPEPRERGTTLTVRGAPGQIGVNLNGAL